MFLSSLTSPELRIFSDWVESIFGYGVKVHRTEGHISIQLHSGERSVNVTDTGYGVSQLLPVLGMIWWAQYRRPGYSTRVRRRPTLRTLAIEQPELHLHPAHQAKLADVFAAIVQSSKSRSESAQPTRLLIETHSEALINRLGELVEQRAVRAETIQIVMFEARDDLGSPTEVYVSTFDKKGALKNWPYGFFKYSSP